MAYQIGALCIRCGECEKVCPAGAIELKDGTYVIDTGLCISCGSCADNCSFGVITPL
jgi:ferredoxin